MKLPEPTGVIDRFQNVWTLDNHKPMVDGEKVYTETQVKQAVSDALEAAAKLIERTEMSGLQSYPEMQLFIAQLLSGYATAIRKLMEGL